MDVQVFRKPKRIIFRFFSKENDSLEKKTKTVSVVTNKTSSEIFHTLQQQAPKDNVGSTRITLFTNNKSKTHTLQKLITINVGELAKKGLHCLEQSRHIVIIRNNESSTLDTKQKTYYSPNNHHDFINHIKKHLQLISKECEEEAIVWKTKYKKGSRKHHTHLVIVQSNDKQTGFSMNFPDFSSNEVLDCLNQKLFEVKKCN